MYNVNILRIPILILGIIITTINFGVYFFWYKKIYFSEFFFIFIFLHGGTSFILYDLLAKTYQNKKQIIEKYTLVFFSLSFVLVFFHSKRLTNKINKHGVKTIGIIKKKKRGYRSNAIIKSTFIEKNNEFMSTYHSNNSDFKNISIGDTVIIKFIPNYPKMNRTLKVVKTN